MSPPDRRRGNTVGPPGPANERETADLEPLSVAERLVETPPEAAARRIDALALVAGRATEEGRARVAAVAAVQAMDEQPDSAAAQKRLHEHAQTLLRAYEALFGGPRGVPVVALPLHELPTQRIDSRAAFLLSRVDGVLSFEEILDISGMPRLEACNYLARLVLQGILDVR